MSLVSCQMPEELAAFKHIRVTLSMFEDVRFVSTSFNKRPLISLNSSSLTKLQLKMVMLLKKLNLRKLNLKKLNLKKRAKLPLKSKKIRKMQLQVKLRMLRLQVRHRSRIR